MYMLSCCSLTGIWWLFKEKEYDYEEKRKPLDLTIAAPILVLEHPSEVVSFFRTKVPAFCTVWFKKLDFTVASLKKKKKVGKVRFLKVWRKIPTEAGWDDF